MKKSLLFLVAAATCLSACGSSNSTPDQGGTAAPGTPGGNPGRVVGPATPGSPNAPAAGPADCASMWNAYVAANPQGRSNTYTVATQMQVNGHSVMNNTKTETDQVTESDANQVVTTVTINNGAPNSMAITQAEFVQSCGDHGGSFTPNPNTSVTVIEEGRKSIDVPAGHFDCGYRKSKIHSTVGGADADTTMEIWTNGDGQTGFVVKSIMVMNSNRGSQAVVQTTTKTLTQHN